MKNGRRPTIDDVARHADVSKSLVSLVVRGDRHVSPERRAAVLRAVGELGYRPNAMAQGLVQRKTRIVGVLVSDLNNPFFADVIAKLGDLKKTMLLDGEMSRYLSETMRPFTHLERLRVGQRWRIRLLDPFALMQNQTIEFQTQLATVAQRETIRHRDQDVDCFRVETPTAIAWVDEFGKVLKQEVRLPLIGTWTLLDEEFDSEARQRAVPDKRHAPATRREKAVTKSSPTQTKANE